MSALAAQNPNMPGPSTSSYAYGLGKDAPLVREMLANPLQWGPPVSKTTLAPSVGVREIAPGPPSPPAGLLQLQSPQKAAASASQDAKRSNGTINGGAQANGHAHSNRGRGAGEEADSEEEEEEEVEGERGESGNAQAGPSQIRPATSASPLKVVPGGTPVAPAATTFSPNGKGKGKVNAADSDARASAQAEAATSVPKRVAPSHRPAPKNELCVPLTEEDLGWPSYTTKKPYGAGLNNPSMACYANSTLQVMLHTPPLLKEAIDHGTADKCQHARTPMKGQREGFCMLCAVRHMISSHSTHAKKSYSPGVHRQLNMIKKGFSKNRQEDTQEFFRFAVDALQNQALFGQPKNLADKVKHTSWVHRIWGGRVRSRVLCSRCLKPSDTFDTYLDLALDCGPKNNRLDGILRGFCKEDKLEGDNKYHCDNCNSKSNATKSFRIAEAPPVLTLHLKRFMTTYNSYNGRAKANKFNGKVEFDEYLDIAPYVIQGNTEPTKYRLFGVTCHRGHELRFGHYTAYVKNPSGKWYMADDEDMSPVPLQRVLNDPTAYLLSYIRITDADSSGAGMTNGRVHSSGVEQHGKRARQDAEESEEEEEEEEEEKPVRTLVAKKRPMIGPVRPSGAAADGTGANGAQTDGPALFTSSFDRSQRQTTPVSPVQRSHGNDNDPRDEGAEDEQEDVSSRFGSALAPTASKAKFSPLAATNFYGQGKHASPISRPRGPGPDSDAHSHSHSHSHSPNGKKHQHRRNKKNKFGRDGEGKHKSGKRTTAAPYKAGGMSGGRGFGGRGKGVLSGMRPRNG